jgi:spore germination protein GerM
VKLPALLLTLALAGVACRSPSVTLLPESDLPSDIYGSPRPTPTPVPTPELPKRGTVYFIREGRLVAVERPLPGVASSLPEGLLFALFQGSEGVKDARSAIPPNTRLNDLVVEGVVATVDLSTDFERGGPGRALALRLAQVVFTLTEDPSAVVGVRFEIDGVARQVIGGLNLTVLDRPVNRGDYEQFVPR